MQGGCFVQYPKGKTMAWHNELEKKDKKYVWHPFTQMKDWLREDIVIIESAEGFYLKDTKGKKYIDGVSSLWTNVHGHRKKALDEALKDQIDFVAHSTFLGLSNVPAILLAEKLVNSTPSGLNKVFYSNSGSEAMEVAFKVVYQYWCQKKNPQPQKKKFVHLKNSYHGDTLGAVSVGGIDLFHEMYRPFIFETIDAPSPYCYRCPFLAEKTSCRKECIEELARIVEERKDEIAAVVIEPLMQGAGGMINQPEGYLQAVRKITEEAGILLVFDEVATGFGHTGAMFAAEKAVVTPDVMALGKGITGGYLPLSATLFTDTLFEAFLGEYEESRTFFHGHTYTGNQLAACVALASLDVFEKEKTLLNVARNSTFLEEKLKAFHSLRQVGDIRQVGLMVGIELVKDKEAKTPFAKEEKIGIRVCEEARRKGVIIRPLGNVIVLMPAPGMPQNVLGELIDITYSAIETLAILNF